jgi:hypothetical protein
MPPRAGATGACQLSFRMSGRPDMALRPSSSNRRDTLEALRQHLEIFAMATSSQGTPRPRALVTGASSGIGRIFAGRLAREGLDVVLVARHRDRLTELAKEIETGGTNAEVVVADLATVEGLEIVERRVAAGDLTMLVNNAGFQVYMPFVELDAARAEAQINVHVTPVVRLCRAALPAMLARGSGSIINVSSMLASAPASIDLSYRSERPTPRQRRSSTLPQRRCSPSLPVRGSKCKHCAQGSCAPNSTTWTALPLCGRTCQ